MTSKRIIPNTWTRERTQVLCLTAASILFGAAFSCGPLPDLEDSQEPEAVGSQLQVQQAQPSDCPDDLRAAAGQACTGSAVCNGDGSDELCSACPDQDCTVLMCEDGAWNFYEVSASTGCGDPDPDTCQVPDYPEQCDGVSTFQCGVDVQCVAGVLQVNWHEHVFCHGPDQPEEIVPYSCAFTCPNGCEEGYLGFWPSDGTDLVAQGCLPAPDGESEGEVPPDADTDLCPGDLRAASAQPCTGDAICNADGSHELCTGCPDSDCTVLLCEQGAWRLYEVSACDTPPGP
ncbi:MAG: hypothetical protein ABIJ09_03125 [Pseudomonadota bacterium]